MIQQILNWLKVHNPLYKDIVVNINNIDNSLTALQNDADDNTSNNVTTETDPAFKHDARENDKVNSSEEENEDPLNEYRAPVSDTCLESVIPNYPVTADDNFSTRTIEKKMVKLLMHNQKCLQMTKLKYNIVIAILVIHHICPKRYH